MGVEHAVEPGDPTLVLVDGLRLLDPEVGGGVGRRADDRVVVAELLERRDQPGRVAGELHAGHVGQRLAAAADGRLHDPADQRATGSAARTRTMARRAVSPLPPPSSLALFRLRPMPNHMKRMPTSAAMAIDADHRDGERRHEDVVVLDVAQLVGEHAFELDPVHASRAARW